MIPVPDVQGLGVAFGDVKHLPKWEDIPETFKEDNNQWTQMSSDWFYKGIKASELKVKEGVDKSKAIKALQSILASFDPKHEHKSAGVAYLASEWFESYTPTKEELKK